MKCTKCGLRDATTEVMQRRNNHIEKMYLCNECAKNFRPDIADDFDIFDKLIGSPTGLLADLGGMFDAPTTRALICPECKTTSKEFMDTGFVGCPKCYEVFEPLISGTVKKLQQADRHVGKNPFGAADVEPDEARLKAELQAAIDRRDFDETVKLSKALQQMYYSNNKREGEL